MVELNEPTKIYSVCKIGTESEIQLLHKISNFQRFFPNPRVVDARKGIWTPTI